jgi:hypothetical protein
MTQEVSDLLVCEEPEKKVDREQFLSLLETLRTTAEKATPGRQVDTALLAQTIKDAVQWYRVDKWIEAQPKATIHEAVEPARALLGLLRANHGQACNILGDSNRLASFVADLETLQAGAERHTPQKRAPNRPPHADLRLFVGHLANGWLVLTGREFTLQWDRTEMGLEPISLGAQFIHAAVKALYPERLAELPQAARKVHWKRNKEKKVPGYFNTESRKDAL